MLFVCEHTRWRMCVKGQACHKCTGNIFFVLNTMDIISHSFYENACRMWCMNLSFPTLSWYSAGTCRIWGRIIGVLDQRETVEGRLSFVGIGCSDCDTNQSVSGYVTETTQREREREREGTRTQHLLNTHTSRIQKSEERNTLDTDGDTFMHK